MAKAAKKKTTKKKSTKRASKKKAPDPRGLEATDVLSEGPPDEVGELTTAIGADGGTCIGAYREPLGSHWCVIASLPIDKVEPTPFQRDLSASHAKRLTGVIDKLDRFLDPIIAVRKDGTYLTPNGNHRLSAMKGLGARAIVALVVPDTDVAYKILALNTEKAHNLKEKSIEVIRMARELATLDDRNESDFSLEFEEPAFLTLGCCYEQKARFSGSAYNPILKRVEGFMDRPLSECIGLREGWAAKLLAVDEAVGEAVKALKERGLDSPYLKTFVVARINPLRGRGATGEPDDVLDRLLERARAFDPGKVRADQIGGGAGGGGEE